MTADDDPNDDESLDDRVADLEGRIDSLEATIEDLREDLDAAGGRTANVRDRYDAAVLDECLNEDEVDFYERRDLARLYRKLGIKNRNTVRTRVEFLLNEHFTHRGYGKYRLNQPET